MIYTYRFAHLAAAPKYTEGDTVRRGDIIGIMGSTGQSTANHLHIDCIVGKVSRPYKLADIGTRYAPDKKQLDYFIDEELFGIKPFITTQFLDQQYKIDFKKDHPAYDVVPIDREHWENGKLIGSKDHFAIHWNRSKPGKVTLVVDQPAGYGHCIYIAMEE